MKSGAATARAAWGRGTDEPGPAKSSVVSIASGKPQEEPAFMGQFYIHNGYPMRGSDVDAQGRMTLLLECYPIPQDKTPGQVRDMKFTHDQAVYIRYFGKVARKSKDEGLVIGYVDHCYGVNKAIPELGDRAEMTVTKVGGTYHPRPQVEYDTNPQRFGEHHMKVASTDEIIALYAKADAIRSPRPVIRHRPSIN